MKEEMGDQHAICYTCRELGELHILCNEPERATVDLSRAMDLCKSKCYIMLEGDIELSLGKLSIMNDNHSQSLAHFQNVRTIFMRQNFLTRLINCYQIELDLLKNIGCFSDGDTKRAAIYETIQRKNREEIMMINRVKPLIAKIKAIISTEASEELI